MLRSNRVDYLYEAVAQVTFDRITVSPEVCSGKPCIRGLRFPVSRLLGLLAAGETFESILEAYPYLEREDMMAAQTSRCLPGDGTVSDHME